MSQALEFVNYKKDAFVIVEGDPKADRFFIIRQGNVRINKEVELIKEEKDVLVPGDFFAVVSTMASRSHIETATALTDVALISIKRDEYSDIIQNNPNIALKIIQQFSKQLRYLNESLTKLTLKQSAATDVSHLFNIAEYYFNNKQYNQAFYAYTKYMEHCPEGENVKTARQHKSSIALQVKEDEFKYKGEGSVRTYPKNALFFCENEPGEELFIIQKGAVKITKILDNAEKLLAILKPGDIFGEMALLENKPRSASAMAHDDECVAMVISKGNFEVIAKKEPQIVSRLTTMLSERIWSTYRQISSTVITDPTGRMYDALLLQLENKRISAENNKAYTFDFGREDLIKMVGIPKEEGMEVIREMLADHKKLQEREGKLFCPDIAVIYKEVQYYVRMAKKTANIEQARAEKQKAGN